LVREGDGRVMALLAAIRDYAGPLGQRSTLQRLPRSAYAHACGRCSPNE
jgi:hypothetical protein